MATFNVTPQIIEDLTGNISLKETVLLIESMKEMNGGNCTCIDLQGNLLTNDFLDSDFEYGNADSITLSFVKKEYFLKLTIKRKTFFPSIHLLKYIK